MDAASLRADLARFAADLTIAGEPVTFDVVVARHLQVFIEAGRAGLTAPRLANLLAQAGARRADGKPITADQIRASVSRAKRRSTAVGRRDATGERRLVPARSALVADDQEAPKRWATAPQASPPAPIERRSDDFKLATDPDVSDADLHAARERLRRL